jgi:peptidoglycan/LPS O-acetylase OafA/YrhL
LDTHGVSDLRDDPPALGRLADLDRRWVPSGTVEFDVTRVRTMGYQPGLDGLRAISVVAVILYHAGFGWMRGGFFGVEVFFVVSGFLITSLLLDEREKNQRVNLGQFWVRRARRLLPALFTMMLSVAMWASMFGTAEQQSTLKRDLPWSIFYLGNWGQILGHAPYFASADPPLLRHLWSLAVEEQWYLIWPLVFIAAMSVGTGRLSSRAKAFAATAFALMVLMFVLHATTPDDGTISVLGNQANRTNFMYLSTFTRASGLLLGAGAAFVWRPWRSTRKMLKFGTRLDPFGAVTLTLLVCIMSVAELTAGYVYQWLLALVSVLSILTIMVVVHPAALGFRALLSWRPLVEIGRRSYGLYLWHWPIFVFSHTYHSGSYTRFVAATLITVAVSEVSYRFIETPIRNDFVHQWFRDQRAAMGSDRVRRIRRTTTVLGVVGAIAVGMVGFYASVAHFDPAVGGTEVFFSVPTIPLPTTVPFDPAVTTTAPVAPVVSVAPSLPRRVTIVGDSQAHALAINLPTGIESTFTINDGSIDGCGVYDTGRVVSTRTSFRRSFADCSGWAEKWGRSASSAKAEVALVVLGAWDVFDLQLADRTLMFGTPEADSFYLAQLQQGIDSLKATGAHVALLEVACMRPKDVKGAGVPALPERGDDTRTGHVNDLLKQAAAKDPTHVTFVAGPQAWCSDQAISVDLAYRWDGVHVYKAGANLIFLIITPALLELPVQ